MDRVIDGRTFCSSIYHAVHSFLWYFGQTFGSECKKVHYLNFDWSCGLVKSLVLA